MYGREIGPYKKPSMATDGWASCSNRARPAPRKIAASLLTLHVAESGPNTPAKDPAACPRTKRSSTSRSSSLTPGQIREGDPTQPKSPAVARSSKREAVTQEAGLSHASLD